MLIRHPYCFGVYSPRCELSREINTHITSLRADKLSAAIVHALPRFSHEHTVYPKKYAHGFCFAVLCCGYTLTDFPISIRLTSLALWQSNDCPSANKATLMNMDKYFMWYHYERLHNHNKANHNKTVCIFLGIYCKSQVKHYGISSKQRQVTLDPQCRLLQYLKCYKYDINYIDWWILLNAYECPFINITQQYTWPRNTVYWNVFGGKLSIWKSDDHGNGKWNSTGLNELKCYLNII